jgi:hypothetical protein
MQRRKFSREFKLEAVRLVRERGVAVNPYSCPLLFEAHIVLRARPVLKGIWVSALPAGRLRRTMILHSISFRSQV